MEDVRAREKNPQFDDLTAMVGLSIHEGGEVGLEAYASKTFWTASERDLLGSLATLNAKRGLVARVHMAQLKEKKKNLRRGYMDEAKRAS